MCVCVIRTPQRILKALRRATANRTTIVIAHRLATVIDADEILVLDKGTVAERGTHLQLLMSPGSLYARLWQKQHSIALEHQAAAIAATSIDKQSDLNSKDTDIEGPLK